MRRDGSRSSRLSANIDVAATDHVSSLAQLLGEPFLALLGALFERIGDGRLREKVRAALPFTLTGSQQAALADIEADLAKPERMTRLLQGDVGSGKTVVALLAATNVIEAGAQAAFMAPTELLVRQHARTIQPLADAAGIRIAVLTGRERGKEREDIVAGRATLADVTATEGLANTVARMSRCGLGQSAPNPILTTMRNFPEAYEARIAAAPFVPLVTLEEALREAVAVQGRQPVNPEIESQMT